MSDERAGGYLPLLHKVADAVAAAFAEVGDFGPSGQRDDQYALDVVAKGAHTQWTSHPVGPAVNNVRNDSQENIRRAEPVQDPQRSLL